MSPDSLYLFCSSDIDTDFHFWYIHDFNMCLNSDLVKILCNNFMKYKTLNIVDYDFSKGKENRLIILNVSK